MYDVNIWFKKTKMDRTSEYVDKSTVQIRKSWNMETVLSLMQTYLEGKVSEYILENV